MLETLTDISFCVKLQVESTNYPGNYPGYDDSWDIERFKEVKEFTSVSP